MKNEIKYIIQGKVKAEGNTTIKVYKVPCPYCDSEHSLQWKNIVWEPGKPETAGHKCPSCNKVWGEDVKREAINRGLWCDVTVQVGQELNHGTEAAVLDIRKPWSDLAKELIAAKNDMVKMKTFVTKTLGLPWMDRVDKA